ncbi:GNAT family N-acetyltransferase [Nocardia tengchongensis]|uniref:GNAT family N-acetyltransferase n=1 Tax=Nocardia tengchongensis TaxID=2055889 RepID=UPI00368C5E79
MPQPVSFASKPNLTGPTVSLRPFTAADVDAMRAMLRDPHVRRLTGSVHDEAAALEAEDSFELDRLRQWYLTRSDQSDRLDLAIIDAATGECVGEVVLNQWDPGNQSCNFRILLGPAGQDRGFGTEATRLIVGYGFESLLLHRISLEVYAFNPRARHVYEKVGFRAEGTRRDAFRYEGTWIDAILMSILAPEWATHRGHPNSCRYTEH